MGAVQSVCVSGLLYSRVSTGRESREDAYAREKCIRPIKVGRGKFDFGGMLEFRRDGFAGGEYSLLWYARCAKI